MLSCAVLVFAVCIDSFAVSVSLGVRGVCVPFFSSVAMSFVGAVFLAASLFLSSFVGAFIPPEIFRYIGACILAALAVACAFGGDVGEDADKDLSGSISLREALFLGAGLFADSLATGFCFGTTAAGAFFTVAAVFVVGIIAVRTGCLVGRRFRKSGDGLRLLSAAAVFLLAILKLCGK